MRAASDITSMTMKDDTPSLRREIGRARAIPP
jgi:hypothetical protein